jgi:3-dehydroquinate dehydratase-2
LLDALKSTKIPCVEVHISKVEERDSFRQISYIREACLETITGKGLDGYVLALEALKEYLKK